MNRDIHSLLSLLPTLKSRSLTLTTLHRIGDVATPEEIISFQREELWNAGNYTSNPEWKEWHRTNYLLLEAAGKKKAEKFSSEKISKTYTLYRGISERSTEEKTLVVGITGKINRLMLPIASILQHLDASQCDLLLMKTSSIYARAGKITTWDDFISSLENCLDVLDVYGSISVFGTSFGGIPAILAADALDAANVLSVGPGSPYALWWMKDFGVDPYEILFQRGNGYGAKLTVLVGSDCSSDIANAREIAELVPTKITKVTRSDGAEIGHICLPHLAMNRQMKSFFDKVFHPRSTQHT